MQIRDTIMSSRGYHCKANLTPDDILSWESTDTEDIRLPCRMVVPIQYTARKILRDHIEETGDNGVGDVEAVLAKASATLQLLVSWDRIHSSFHLYLPFVNGDIRVHWLPDVMGPRYSHPILHEFFKRGGAGLTEERREVWKGHYKDYRDWQKMRYGSYARDYGNIGADDEDGEEEVPIMIPRTEALPYQPDN